MFKINGAKLTRRETDIAACVISGHSWKAIAKLLGISIETLHSHIKHIKCKTRCCSRDHLVNLIELSDEYKGLQRKYVALIKIERLQREGKN